MPVTGVHHYTLRCAPADLPSLHDFYTRFIGLTVGPRPVMSAPGYWLYSGGQPIVHLYAILDEAAPWAGGPVTGPLDHVSFRAKGLEETRALFDKEGLAYDEAPVPGWPLHQVFVRDPKGIKLELTFFLDEETAGWDHGNADAAGSTLADPVRDPTAQARERAFSSDGSLESAAND